MLPPLLDRFTPRTSAKTRLFTAACFWTSIGIFLASKGVCIMRHAPWPTLVEAGLGGLSLGIIKSRLIFDKVAGKVITRIRLNDRPSCLGGLFSLRNWLLILCMMILGKIMGTLAVPIEVKSVMYMLVGSGLCYSSRLMWTAWKKTPDIILHDLRRG